LLTTPQAAHILGIKPNTLENWRCTKRVLVPHVKVGRSIRYRQADLQKFIEDRSHD
jgi:excisionase family DNA binding protein